MICSVNLHSMRRIKNTLTKKSEFGITNLRGRMAVFIRAKLEMEREMEKEFN